MVDVEHGDSAHMERLMGERHSILHYGYSEWIGDEDIFHIMHSGLCLATQQDLLRCEFSIALRNMTDADLEEEFVSDITYILRITTDEKKIAGKPRNSHSCLGIGEKWQPLGTHVDFPGLSLEFRNYDESGMPKEERVMG